jgi:hypothetical protein
MFRDTLQRLILGQSGDAPPPPEDDYYDTSDFGFLQRGIERRVQELHALAASTAKYGARLTFFSNAIKVTTITLGAVTAAKATLGAWLSIEGSALLFTTFAVVISVSTGLEAAFRLDRRGNGLTSLSSDAMSSARTFDSEWRKKIGSETSEPTRLTAGRQLLTELDKRLREYTVSASRFGVCYAREIYSGRNEYVKRIHQQHSA